jgi:hypothetical protein
LNTLGSLIRSFAHREGGTEQIDKASEAMDEPLIGRGRPCSGLCPLRSRILQVRHGTYSLYLPLTAAQRCLPAQRASGILSKVSVCQFCRPHCTSPPPHNQSNLQLLLLSYSSPQPKAATGWQIILRRIASPYDLPFPLYLSCVCLTC